MKKILCVGDFSPYGDIPKNAMPVIYADHAATTALLPAAQKAMIPYLTQQYGNPSSIHAAGLSAARSILLARETMANDLHCEPREIYFTSGGSEANNQALYTLAEHGRKNGKLHLISTAFEHPSVLRPLEYLQSLGFAVTLVKPQPDGVVAPADIVNALRPDTAAVSVMLANNEIGTVQPLAEIAARCQAHGIFVHTDAVQAVGHIPVDFAALGVDALTLSAHKFGGPKGSGALVLRRSLQPFSLIRGGGQERNSRAGTENVSGIVGMAAALRQDCAHLTENAKKITALREQLIAGMLQIPGVFLTGNRIKRLPGTAHFIIEGVEAETMLALLDAHGICASAGSACSAGALTQSHVLKSLGVSSAFSSGSLRLSLGEDNTPEEVAQIIAAVCKITIQLRKG